MAQLTKEQRMQLQIRKMDSKLNKLIELYNKAVWEFSNISSIAQKLEYKDD